LKYPPHQYHNSSVHLKEKVDKLTVSVFIAEEQLRVAGFFLSSSSLLVFMTDC
jgi:hypothetical protein